MISDEQIYPSTECMNSYSIHWQTVALQSSSSSQWEVPIELGNGTTTKRSGPMNKKKTHTHTHKHTWLTYWQGWVLSSRSHLESSFDEISCSSRIVGGYYDKSNNYWGAGGRERECCMCRVPRSSCSDGRIITGWELLLLLQGKLINKETPFLTDTFWQESSLVFNAPSN
jgi:hypothetical protein